MRIFYALFFFALSTVMSNSFAAAPVESKMDALKSFQDILSLRTLAELPPGQHWGLLHVRLKPKDSYWGVDKEQVVKDAIADALKLPIETFSPTGYFECTFKDCGCQQFTAEDYNNCECGHSRATHKARIFPITFHIYHDLDGNGYHLWISIIGRTDDMFNFVKSMKPVHLSEEIIARVSIEGWVVEPPTRELRTGLKESPRLLAVAHFMNICFKTQGVGDPDGLFNDYDSEADENDDSGDEGADEQAVAPHACICRRDVADEKESLGELPDYKKNLRFLDKGRFLKFAEKALGNRDASMDEEVYLTEEELAEEDLDDPRYKFEYIAILGGNDDRPEVILAHIFELKTVLEKSSYFSMAPQELRFALAWPHFSLKKAEEDRKKSLLGWGRLSWTGPAILLNAHPWGVLERQLAMDYLDLTSAAINLALGSSKIFLHSGEVINPRIFADFNRPQDPNLIPYNAVRAGLKPASLANWDSIVDLTRNLVLRSISETITAIENWNQGLKPKLASEKKEKKNILEVFYDVLTDLCTGATTFHHRNLYLDSPPQEGADGALATANLDGWIDFSNVAVSGPDDSQADATNVKNVLLNRGHLMSDNEELVLCVPYFYPVSLHKITLFCNEGSKTGQPPKEMKLYANLNSVDLDELDEVEPTQTAILSGGGPHTIDLKRTRFSAIDQIVVRLGGVMNPFASSVYLEGITASGFDAKYVIGRPKK